MCANKTALFLCTSKAKKPQPLLYSPSSLPKHSHRAWMNCSLSQLLFLQFRVSLKQLQKQSTQQQLLQLTCFPIRTYPWAPAHYRPPTTHQTLLHQSQTLVFQVPSVQMAHCPPSIHITNVILEGRRAVSRHFSHSNGLGRLPEVILAAHIFGAVAGALQKGEVPAF